MAKLVQHGNQKIDLRYRPCRLSEVFGNEAVVEGLKKWFLLPEDKRHRVLLFRGPAGNGKTTIARILALGLNCERTPGAEPCLECDSCKSILAGTAMNIVEKNMSQSSTKEGADEVSDEIYSSCMVGNKKIIILDECHKMSDGSQNLLLKPIEEPPQNVYLFLCTSEPKGLIKAIQTRIQTFDVLLPSKETIKSFLGQLYVAEGWTSSNEDKILLFNHVTGMGFREILNVTEQFILGGKDVLSKTCAGAESPEIFELAKLIVYKGDFPKAMETYKKIKEASNFNYESFRYVVLGCLTSSMEKAMLSREKDKVLTYCDAIELLREPFFEAKPEYRFKAIVAKLCLVFSAF